MARKTLNLFKRYVRKTCYHCGSTGDLFEIDDYVIRGESICVCENCRFVYHGCKSKVIVFERETNAPIDEAYIKETINADEVYIDHIDPKKNEVNMLAVALFLSGEYATIFGTNKTYFVVSSINRFKSSEELLKVIDTLIGRGAVFFSINERIDTSTANGLRTIMAIKDALNIDKKTDQ